MISLRQRLAVAGLLASAAFAAAAQTPPPGGPMMGHGPMGVGPHGAQQGGPMAGGRHDPAQMQTHMAERQARRLALLKAQLKLDAGQEGAWKTFTEAMKPQPHKRPAPEEMAALTTPERIDRMQALKAERDAHQTRRANAVKTFYAVLTAEQKRSFDAATLRVMQGGPRGEHGGPGGHHGGGHPGMMGPGPR